MKTVAVIIGSPHKGETYKAVQKLEDALSKLGEYSFDHVLLKDLNIKPCKGCLLCFCHGEERCPNYSDDLQIIAEKLAKAEGVIFATPVYSLQVSALMKNVLDRLAYVFHRPSMFGKTGMALATQGIYGSKSVLKYLSEIMWFWGFNVSPGIALWTPPGERKAKQEQQTEKAINQGALRFHRRIHANQYPTPTVKRLALFRMVRATKPLVVDLMPRDCEYFREQGWLNSSYFYPTKLSPIKSLVGSVVDFIGKRMS